MQLHLPSPFPPRSRANATTLDQLPPQPHLTPPTSLNIVLGEEGGNSNAFLKG